MSQTIGLTQGQRAVVDDCDADLVVQKWHAVFMPDYAGGAYVASRGAGWNDGKHRTELMHRVILARVLGRALTRSERVDHKDLNTLNNQRANLRLATVSENGMNRGAQRNNTSGYKGVAWHKGAEKWRAQIVLNRVARHLGLFDTPEAAARAYDKAALELHGEFARLNFGESA